MAAIKSVEAIAKKWTEVTPGRAADYQAGIENPRVDWAQATKAAEDNWKQGITEAAARGAFGKGVTAAGTATWQEGSLTKGVARWGPGIALSGDKYAKGFAPYREAIFRTTLPPRFPRRDPRNLLRVKAIVDALVKVKVGLGG